MNLSALHFFNVIFMLAVVIFISIHLFLLTFLPFSPHLTSIPWWELGHIWGRNKQAVIYRLHSVYQMQVTKIIRKMKSHKWKLEYPEALRALTWGRPWEKEENSRKEFIKKHTYKKGGNGLAGIKMHIEICLAYTRRRDFQILKKLWPRSIFRLTLGTANSLIVMSSHFRGDTLQANNRNNNIKQITLKVKMMSLLLASSNNNTPKLLSDFTFFKS